MEMKICKFKSKAKEININEGTLQIA